MPVGRDRSVDSIAREDVFGAGPLPRPSTTIARAMHRIFGEAIRLIRAQPSVLAIPIQASLVGVPSLLLWAWTGKWTNSNAGSVIWTFITVSSWLYAAAAVWGSIVEATGRPFHVKNFWVQGFRYFGRTVFGLAWAISLFL